MIGSLLILAINCKGDNPVTARLLERVADVVKGTRFDERVKFYLVTETAIANLKGEEIFEVSKGVAIQQTKNCSRVGLFLNLVD